jgi:SAM-dependent methyltransferase
VKRLRADSSALEYLDQPKLDPSELRVALRDVERLNRWFGGADCVLREVGRLSRERGLSGAVRVLDVGSGGADIPRALARWGRRNGLHFHSVACDRHEQMGGVAADFGAGDGSISILRADALAPPFAPRSFDFVTCSLMLHHLAEDDVPRLLEAVRPLARHGLIFCDLERSGRAYAGAWLATHLFCRGRFTRHDGPMSVRRAYTIPELTALARQAGCGDMRWSRRAFFRLVGVLEV